ncbi:outer membrane protein assembly factor BamA [Candidatus Pelagibacter communis]|uniref:Outer membrane protein assembly factor BamA n=1 Tax=Pelagibacter ubique (strain HTCC1062) TaxID=335992 RepID=Q4FM63_PELUB|nr:outer membrane protein assembly factor BamA [Candidatus Pelagibacter ubique]AAZ21726.1 outer membrane protein omp1 [Candidatus Pelagibacter ubique HTCC1062]
MFRFFIQLILLSIFLTFSSNSKNYEKIIINGNERISNETILVFSEIQDNIPLDENSINEILKKLYKSGFFKDVAVKIENNNLTIDVLENPIIQTVLIEGIKRKKTKESLYEILSLKNRSSYNSTLIKKDESAILSFLKDDGYYFSKVTSSYQDLGDNKIDLLYQIELGEKSKISKISFIGDKKFKDSTLKNIIISEEYKFWKFLSGKKYLNENLINYDKRLLNNFYKNKGFFNVVIESSFANYLGNDEFEIIYNISSGNKFYFNEFNLNLPLDYDRANFQQLDNIFKNLKGENYSLNSIDKILKEIDKIVLNEQFEFLKSTVNESIEDNLINLTFDIDESEKFYVEKINILGNNVTLEEVIRNNLLVDEGDAFNELLQTRTLNNLRGLNFFRKVETEILDIDNENKKIINITVEEKPTGEIMAGAGVGTGGGTFAFGVSENNFLGRGIEFASDISVSTESLKGIISMNNPNYKGSNRSLNTSLESTITDRLKNFGYKSNKTGFSVGSGFEFYDDLYWNTGVSSYVEKLETDSTASASMKKQEGSYFDTFFNHTFSYDKRDQRYKTSDGYISRFSQNIPLISESYTLTNTYDYKIYNEWLDENIFSIGFFGQISNSLAGKDIKLSDRLYLPASKLRGFESGKVGPKDGADFIGGNYAASINIATSLSQILPNSQNTNFSVFFDAANVWGIDYSSSLSDESKIRSSVGIAVDFFTPVGPLNFSLTEAITKGKNDITESFRFNLGTTF